MYRTIQDIPFQEIRGIVGIPQSKEEPRFVPDSRVRRARETIPYKVHSITRIDWNGWKAIVTVECGDWQDHEWVETFRYYVAR